ncbi:sulfotransferase, partial [Kibdelosporangium lantanae]
MVDVIGAGFGRTGTASLKRALEVLGFELIMRMQTVITVVTAVLTVVYIVFVASRIDFTAVAAIPSGSAQSVIGAFVFLMTGFGLGWSPEEYVAA